MKNSIFQALSYKLIERFSIQIVSFIISLILARVLSPDEYGTLSLLLIFINLATVFVQSGLNTALIQKLEVTESDYSTVFFPTLGLAFLFYFILFFLAPYIQDLYNVHYFEFYLRVLSLMLFPGALLSIQQAKISRELRFDILAKCSFVGTLASGVVGITMAYCNLGIWALIAQQLLTQIFSCIILLFVVDWKPRLFFSFDRFKIFFSFGWKILCSGLLNSLYIDLQNLIIGKKYNATTLGLYTRGQQFPQVLINNIDGSVNSVLLPALSKEQKYIDSAKNLMRRAVKTSSYIIWPMMLGLVVVAEPTIRLILTDKWLGCVPYLQIFCITYAFMPISTVNLQAINAMGRSDIFLRLEVIKKIYGLVILLIAVFCFKSPFAIAISGILSGIISTFVNANPNKKLLNYSYFEQIRDIVPSILLSSGMAIVIYPFKYIILNSILLMIVQIFSGIFVYILLSALFRVEEFRYLWNCGLILIKNKNKRGKK